MTRQLFEVFSISEVDMGFFFSKGTYEAHSNRRPTIATTGTTGRSGTGVGITYDTAGARNSIALSGLGAGTTMISVGTTAGEKSGPGNGQLSANGAGRLPTHEIRRYYFRFISCTAYPIVFSMIRALHVNNLELSETVLVVLSYISVVPWFFFLF